MADVSAMGIIKPRSAFGINLHDFVEFQRSFYSHCLKIYSGVDNYQH
jgi:hypothetical protein